MTQLEELIEKLKDRDREWANEVDAIIEKSESHADCHRRLEILIRNMVGFVKVPISELEEK